MTSAAPHIAFLTPFLHHASGFGGITPWLVNLANGFVERGATVDILVNARKDTPLVYAPLNPAVRIINQGYHKYEAFRSLLDYLKHQRPNVLLTAGHRYNAMGAWASLLSSGTTKVYLSVHENVSAGSRDMKPMKRWLRYLGIRHLFPHTQGVIAVSQGVADDLVDIGLTKTCSHVIYNPIVHPELTTKAEEPLDHPWFTPKTQPVILSVGRLEKQKDYHTLIRAFAQLNQQHACRLLILGEGRERASLQTLINELGLHEQVSMPGHISNPLAYMARADIYAMSSAWEGFPIVLGEALAVGLPIVSTDCPSGPSEFLDDGNYGPLVPVGDAAALAKALAETLEHPTDRDTLLRRAQDFSVNKSVDQYWNLLTGQG